MRSFSYITLLRNESYRCMVDSVFDHGRETLEDPKSVSEDALLRISSLQAQVNLLKDRLSGIRTGDNSNALVDANAQDTIKSWQLEHYINRLQHNAATLSAGNQTLTVYSTMRQRFQQVTKVVSSPTEKEKIAGLYSSVGFIAELEALHEIEDGRKFWNSCPSRIQPFNNENRYRAENGYLAARPSIISYGGAYQNVPEHCAFEQVYAKPITYPDRLYIAIERNLETWKRLGSHGSGGESVAVSASH